MNIIITGASNGLGYETAKAFYHQPDNCIIAISRDKKRLEALASECKVPEHTSSIFPLPFDLLKEDYLNVLKPYVVKVFDHVDILINNAGMLINKPFNQFTIEEYDQIFDINLKSVVRLTQLFLPMLRKGSHIVNISSMGGVQGSVKYSGMSLYSASKGALAVLTECLAEEFKIFGIKVNCLALGAMDTDMFRNAFPGYQAPLDAATMAEFVMHFALNGHRYFNGKILPVALTTP
jgi:NAD(P)-dependent dehydrogenase (short-subunit alcohol dehydrogenase family)